MLTTDCSSLPWVVKSSPWSAESGGVPAAIVIVPPCFPPELPLVLPELVPLDDDEDELPHAASATADATARTAVHAARLSVLIDPPPPRVVGPRKSNPPRGPPHTILLS